MPFIIRLHVDRELPTLARLARARTLRQASALIEAMSLWLRFHAELLTSHVWPTGRLVTLNVTCFGNWINC
ncbi:hypothetical protein ACVMB1_000232 [Bradyrhizobium sp. USDA 4504]